jgi:hypothetical protein
MIELAQERSLKRLVSALAAVAALSGVLVRNWS